MSSGSVQVPPGEGVAPLNFIYACSVCCYSFADVYQGHNKTVKGFSDGINPKERIVTHLYLGSCCHVFCSSHIEGGGPSFHPDGQRPKAPCPVCIKEKSDSEPRDLYSIRGFQKDEYDPMIPPAWFTAQPVRLDGNGREMEALRFQYLALVRYCQNTHATRKPMQEALDEAERKLAAIQNLAAEEHAKVLELQQDNEKLRSKAQVGDSLKTELERLQGVEQEAERYRRLKVNPKDIETFVNNKDQIRHYLKLYPMLVEQNRKMQERLASLGFAMALEPVPNNFKALDPHALDEDEDYNGRYPEESGAPLRKTASSRTVGRSAHTSGNASVPSSPFMRRPLKRQRLESPLPRNMQVDQPTSRDAMPPPQKPISRMQSVTRKIIPTLRKKFTHGGRIASVVDNKYTSNGDIPMYGNGYGESSSHVQSADDRYYRGETPYMSGALPVERPFQVSDSRESQLLSSVGVDNDKPDFTFRASSPVKMSKQGGSHQPVQLPTEPSYIRLMDGLTSDNGVELGLKDPRKKDSHTYQDDAYHIGNGTRQVISYQGSGQKRHEMDDQEYGSSRHPFRRQSPLGYYFSASHSLQPSHGYQANGYTSRTYQDSPYHPTTPVPRRDPAHQVESVVSPFVKSNHQITPMFFKSRIAELQDSSNRSVVYPSQNFRTNQPQTGWHEPRSLNGLSLFESPVNSRNQPIQHHSDQRISVRPSPSESYQTRNLNSQGFIMRPETGQSPFFRDSAYGSSRERPPHSRQQPVSLQPAISFPSLNRSSYTRTGPLPLTMPSIVSGRTPVRTQPQWQALQRMGVRSSRRDLSNIAGNTFEGPKIRLLSSTGRRRVKR